MTFRKKRNSSLLRKETQLHVVSAALTNEPTAAFSPTQGTLCAPLFFVFLSRENRLTLRAVSTLSRIVHHTAGPQHRPVMTSWLRRDHVYHSTRPNPDPGSWGRTEACPRGSATRPSSNEAGSRPKWRRRNCLLKRVECLLSLSRPFSLTHTRTLAVTCWQQALGYE